MEGLIGDGRAWCVMPLSCEGEGTPLRIDRQVVPITLGIYGDEVVADLSLLEEERISDLVTVVTDQERQVRPHSYVRLNALQSSLR